MKKVINGTLCNTETATKIGEYEYSYRSQFNWYYETLYRTKSGKYFLYGEGNRASPYAYACPTGGFDPGEKIRLLEYEDAKKWAEEKIDVDEYIKIFGDPEENEKIDIHIKISKEAQEKLEKLKKESKKSYGEIINSILLKLEK